MKVSIKVFFILYGAFFLFGGVLAPIFAHYGAATLADKLYFIFAHSCHQHPDRTFWIFNYPMAICARCFGIYFGYVCYLISSLFNKTLNLKNAVFLLIIGSSEIVFESITTFQGSNIIRSISGLMIGIFVASIVEIIVKKIGGKRKCLV